MRVLLLGALGSSCTPLPPSAPHPLLQRFIRWPTMHRSCGAEDPVCQAQKGGTFEADKRPRVVEFWSPYCPPCQSRLVELYRKRGELQARGWQIEIVAVLESDESVSSVLDTLRNWGTFNSTWVISQTDSTPIGIYGLPSLWLVSSQRRLLWVAPPNATIDEVIVAAERTQ